MTFMTFISLSPPHGGVPQETHTGSRCWQHVELHTAYPKAQVMQVAHAHPLPVTMQLIQAIAHGPSPEPHLIKHPPSQEVQ